MVSVPDRKGVLVVMLELSNAFAGLVQLADESAHFFVRVVTVFGEFPFQSAQLALLLFQHGGLLAGQLSGFYASGYASMLQMDSFPDVVVSDLMAGIPGRIESVIANGGRDALFAVAPVSGMGGHNAQQAKGSRQQGTCDGFHDFIS